MLRAPDNLPWPFAELTHLARRIVRSDRVSSALETCFGSHRLHPETLALDSRFVALAPDAVHPRPAPRDPMRPTLTAIYEEHYEYVWRTLLRLGVRDAEDAAQNVFLVAHRKLSTFDPTRPIRPWLFGIAFNVARETRRKASERYERAIGSNGDSIGDVIGDAHSSDASRLEAAQLVHVALAEVEESRRAVFVLYELDQEPMKEVADALGIPLNTAYSSLRRARQEFCDAVERLGGR